MKRQIAEWYIRNKEKIISVAIFFGLIAIVSIIVGILSRINRNEETGNIEEGIFKEQEQVANFTDIYVESGESVITGDDITETQKTMLNYVNDFVNLCNSQKVEDAYNLLSDDCKEELYTSIDLFRDNYYNVIFNQKRNISVELWIDNTYKVTFEPDSLSTGIYSTENTVQDYISVVNNGNDEIKLNINGYIGRGEINKEKETNSLSLTVLRKDTYMEYEKYTYRIKNNTNNTILLDDKNSTNNTYLEDERGHKYTAYLHELNPAELTITPGETKEVTIKYYNRFSSEKNIRSVVFNEVILNYGASELRKTARVQIDL